MIDICLLQEVEIDKDYSHLLLSSRNYKIEIENNTGKARCAIAIKNNINYIRRNDLVDPNLGLVVIDVDNVNKYRLVNVYRQFTPPDNLSQTEHFTKQLDCIKNLSTQINDRKLIIAGDFNLDDLKRHSISYQHKHLFSLQNELFDELNLIQLVTFPTWQRIINNVKKESILDHVYTQDPTIVKSIDSYTPLIGDHKLLVFNVILKKSKIIPVTKRNWHTYSKDKLMNLLRGVDFNIEADEVQAYWNKFETTLITIIDNVAPLEPFLNNCSSSSTKPTGVIKRKINLRKRLLRLTRVNPSNELRDRIKNLNVEIKNHFLSKKTSSVRRRIIPGNSKSLWDAVKIAKDINIPKLPNTMYLNNTKIENNLLPDAFAEFFKSKVETIVNEQVISDTVYNGVRKLHSNQANFMTELEIIKVVKTLKPKNSEGHDRIPIRIIKDGIQSLIKPLKILFTKVYEQKKIPEQWLISKIIPIHKKGNAADISNYRPISNLCSCSKIYEKLILSRINSLEKTNNIDLTGKSQHGFKPKHSTLTAGLRIQSLITRAVDDDMSVLMASLDLSAAFDVVNVELLLKRLTIIGLPSDVVELISVWLNSRHFYVCIDGESSFIHQSSVGTVQGSVLGPILYSLFVSPLLDLEKLTLFADDNYALVWNKHRGQLITEMQSKLEKITKWLKDSGLKVNEAKTELCLFHRKDQVPITIYLNNEPLTTKPHMNVLGVAFDCKMNWQTQIEHSITKAKKALNAIKLIRKHFKSNELLNLITSNYYSILYYNSEIWHIPSNTHNSKKQMLSASALPLKLCTYNYDRNISFQALHTLHKRATPPQIMAYKHALLLHKVYNDNSNSPEWLDLFANQTFNNRSRLANFIEINKYKIGKNLLCNRFTILNNKISYESLNLSYESYKINCKELLLK